MEIARPNVSILRLPSGKTTYTVTADHWTNEYSRMEYLDDESVTKKKMKAFTKLYDEKAKAIEEGTTRPYNIMGTFVQQKQFRSIRKVDYDPSTI